MLNNQGRPTGAGALAWNAHTRETFTRNRGLAMEEPLIFEVGRLDSTGVDIDEPESFTQRLGKHARTAPIDMSATTMTHRAPESACHDAADDHQCARPLASFT